MGIEPTPPAWKAGALPLSYTRKSLIRMSLTGNSFSATLESMMAGAGFEPAKAEPPDLQSGPFGHSGIPPKCLATAEFRKLAVGFEPTTTGLQNRYSAVELR